MCCTVWFLREAAWATNTLGIVSNTCLHSLQRLINITDSCKFERLPCRIHRGKTQWADWLPGCQLNIYNATPKHGSLRQIGHWYKLEARSQTFSKKNIGTKSSGANKCCHLTWMTAVIWYLNYAHMAWVNICIFKSKVCLELPARRR